MCGKARDMFVRSIKAIVYIIRATGMIRIQRSEIPDREASIFAACCPAVVIEMTNPATWKVSHRRFSKYSLRLYFVHPNFGVLILVMRDGEIVAIQFRHENTGLCTEGSWNLRQ
jgi:hypothetical protein